MRSSSVRPRPNTTSGRDYYNNHITNNNVATSTTNHRTPSTRASSNINMRSSSVTPQPAFDRIVNKKYANVKSRIDVNSEYVSQPSNVKIFHQPLKFDNVSPKVGSLLNAGHVPGGGRVKIENRKLNWSATPRIEDKSTLPIPKNEKKILTQKLNWNAQSKIGSLDNIKHKPAGGDIRIFNEKVKFDNVSSKVGSLENAAHVPSGSNIKISEYAVNAPRSVRSTDSRNSMQSNLSANHSRRSSSTARTQDR